MKGYIYKLTSPNTDMIYIGSTCATLTRRYNKHKNDSDCSSKILFEFGNVSIHLIREVECDTKLELRKQEQIEMDKYDGKLCNKNVAYRTPEYIKEYQKKHNTSDKHKIYAKEYRKCDKRKTYMKGFHKEYQKTDKHKSYQKAYHTSNKAKEYRIIYEEYKKSHFGILCKSYGIFL